MGGRLAVSCSVGIKSNWENRLMQRIIYSALAATLLAFASPAVGATHIGWVAGGSPYTAHTADGSTWASQAAALNLVTTSDMNGVHALSSSRAVIVGNNPAANSGVFRTVDGGITWLESSVTGVSNNPNWFAVDFAGLNYGWTVGADLWLATSSNGGANWIAQQLDSFPTISGRPNLNAVQVLSTDVIFSVGNNGHIIRSTDGGANWGLTRFDSRNLHDVMFVDGSSGWTVGVNGVVFHTSDGGANWSEQTTPITGNLNGVWFTSATVGWAVGNGGRVLATDDGGDTWDYLYGSGSTFGTSVFDTHILHGITFGDSQTGWIIGNNGQIWGTIDGGNSWVTQFGPSGVSALRSISMVTIPEPTALNLLMSCGICGLGAMILRRHSKRQGVGV